ncbi:acetyl-CoA carboxylase biotin carboxyl carrier protein [Rhodovarius crocodyli]|uniref:Biotin carboxyl carrier protein of acetyl-CoA carboxylase n=1 Tax=Rhodovarius crocodyli TaxID=1979269 RepID=A0A437MDV2_9PROT|nr:acetyl-CoA carboxylase biotin carboxyl carrier protein [Rhodovarius crocodyli]
MDLVKQLIALLPQSGASEIEVAEGGVRVRIVARGATSGAVVAAPVAAPPAMAAPPPTAEPVPAAAPAAGEIIVKATMHGVFHRAPAPGAPPFVEVGATVGKRQQLCILEAMKVFNAVNAPQEGTVTAILAENGTDVVLGQPLFTIKPA